MLSKFKYKIVKSKVIPKYYYAGYSKKLDISTEVPIFSILATEVIDSKLTLLNYDRLYTIFNSLKIIKDGHILFEIGAYKGGTSLFVSKVLKNVNYKHFIIDTFEGHKDAYFEHDGFFHKNKLQFTDTSFKQVKNIFSNDQRVEVVKARIQDFSQPIDKNKIKFIHLDTDLFEPTQFALENYALSMSPNSIVIVDDYHKSTTPGVTKAVDAFIKKFGNKFIFLPLLTAQAVLVKT